MRVLFHHTPQLFYSVSVGPAAARARQVNISVCIHGQGVAGRVTADAAATADGNKLAPVTTHLLCVRFIGKATDAHNNDCIIFPRQITPRRTQCGLFV
jgi:hypothetical protein